MRSSVLRLARSQYRPVGGCQAMMKYEFEVTAVLFLEGEIHGHLRVETQKVSVSAKDFLDGIHKAVDIVKQDYSNLSEKYDIAIKTGNAYFNVGVAI